MYAYFGCGFLISVPAMRPDIVAGGTEHSILAYAVRLDIKTASFQNVSCDCTEEPNFDGSRSLTMEVYSGEAGGGSYGLPLIVRNDSTLYSEIAFLTDFIC